LSLINFIFPPLLLENLVIKIFWQLLLQLILPAVIIQSTLLLGCIISDETGLCKPATEEVPQEVNDDRNEAGEER
jgi:hypothetical protein